jgi:hypothetical protein
MDEMVACSGERDDGWKREEKNILRGLCTCMSSRGEKYDMSRYLFSVKEG